MTEREELLRRLERVKALAERGVGGEKENAEALLNRLMAKYSISEEDIEDTAERDYFIRYHNFWERKLIVQIAYKHLGSGHCCGTVGTQSGRPHKKICVTCTPAQYIEIEADFEFYKAAWEEELAIFYSAFISKNDIFPPPELASPSDDDEIDLVRLEKVRAMMSGIDRRTRSMEYHWYEDYWTMPRNLPKGHQFFIGYYQTQRAIRFHVENIHTDQSVFLSTWLLDNGYRVFLHFKSGIVTELKLGDNPPPVGRINSPKNLEGLLLSGCLGKLSE